MRLPNEPDNPPRIDILPMIDVIFAILVYFIVSSLFLTRTEGLPVNLPQAGTTEVQKSTPITVTIDEQGVVSVGDEATNITELQTKIEQIVAEEQRKTVIINADKNVEHGSVVEVLDTLREISEINLAIAAKQKVE